MFRAIEPFWSGPGSPSENFIGSLRFSTLAHEATHKATQSLDDAPPRDVEKKCFGPK